MRKKIFIFLVIFIILLSGCYSDGSIIGSLPKYKNKEFYSDNSVQDLLILVNMNMRSLMIQILKTVNILLKWQ